MASEKALLYPTRPQWPSSIAPFIQAIEQRDDFAERLAALVARLGHKLTREETVELAAYARFLEPHNATVWALTNTSIRQSVPSWHAVLLSDERRNQVYEAAIRASIERGMTVLEIGTGSGILAMMAARAGAEHVYTIEIQPTLAAAAKANIVRNGFAEKITVINASSLDVKVGTDLPVRCDALIQEIISNDLFSQQLTILIADAKARLLKPDASLIPDRVWATGQPVADHSEWQLPQIRGFDLTTMSLFAPNRQQFYKLASQPLGDPAILLTLDLTGNLSQQQWRCQLTANQCGKLNGILQWIGIGFPDGQKYENPPGTPSCWAPLMHWLSTPLPIQPNDLIQLKLNVFDDQMLIIDVVRDKP